MSTADFQKPDPSLADVQRQERAIWQGLLVDLVAVIPAVIISLLSGSLLLLADVADYLRSFAVNGTSLHILRRIRKGQTTGYDYGPGKLECMGSIFGAGCFIAGLLTLGVLAIRRFTNGAELQVGFTLGGMLVQVASIFVNGWFWYRNKRIAMETGAQLIDMQWRHNRTDALASGAIAATLALVMIFRHHSWSMYIDPVGSLVYAIYAIALYIPVLRNAFYNLLDHTLAEDLQLKIVRRLAAHFDRYEAFCGVRSRRSGNRIFIEIGLSFNPERRVGEALETITALRQDIQADIPSSEVMISLLPQERVKIDVLENARHRIIPLSPSTLEPALELIHKTFTLFDHDMPREELEESLWPGKHAETMVRVDVSDPRYWVVVHEGRVVGLMGLYFKPSDPEAAWSGWVVYAEERRCGLSRSRTLMLRKLGEEFLKTGRAYFRLDTTTEPVSRSANCLYDRVGVAVYKTELCGNTTRQYRQADQATIRAFVQRLASVQPVTGSPE